MYRRKDPFHMVEICQNVRFIPTRRFLGEMQRAAFSSPIAIVRVCAYVCVCMCVSVCVCMSVCMPRWWISRKRLEINPPFFSTSRRPHKKPSNDFFVDVVARDFHLVSEGQRFESRPFRYIKRDYLANGDK